MNKQLIKYDEEKKLNDQIDNITLDLEISNEISTQFKNLEIKNNRIVNDGNHNLDITQIKNLSKLLDKTQSTNVKNKFNQLKSNIAESTIHSKIESKVTDDKLVNDVIDLVNYSLDGTNQYYADKIMEDENKCPSRTINPHILDCDDKQNYRKIHPDKNFGCKETASNKFKIFEEKCKKEKLLKTPNVFNFSQTGGSELNRVAQKISNALNFSEKNKIKFNDFFQQLEIPEMSKTFDDIRNTLQSENIDKKIYNYQINNTQYWSNKTKEKYEDFKKNIATLEILSIIERFKMIAKEKGTLSNEEVDHIMESLLDVINQTFNQNNERQRKNNFDEIIGGSDEKTKFNEYLKYKKYKEKYLKLKLR